VHTVTSSGCKPPYLLNTIPVSGGLVDVPGDRTARSVRKSVGDPQLARRRIVPANRRTCNRSQPDPGRAAGRGTLHSQHIQQWLVSTAPQ